MKIIKEVWISKSWFNVHELIANKLLTAFTFEIDNSGNIILKEIEIIDESLRFKYSSDDLKYFLGFI